MTTPPRLMRQFESPLDSGFHRNDRFAKVSLKRRRYIPCLQLQVRKGLVRSTKRLREVPLWGAHYRLRICAHRLKNLDRTKSHAPTGRRVASPTPLADCTSEKRKLPKTHLTNSLFCVNPPFDRLRANGKANYPFVLSLTKHELARRSELRDGF